jgi:hypothetical protein
MYLLLVFGKFFDPSRHFTLKMYSSAPDGLIGPSIEFRTSSEFGI